jgi:hypothetical protein
MSWADYDDPYLYPPPECVTHYFVGLDLGQAHDPSALAVLERNTFPRLGAPTLYGARHLRRWHLGTPYTEIVEDVARLLGMPLLAGAKLVVDGTGVGRPVVDLLRRVPELAGRIVSVVITAGHAFSWGADGSYHVPKKDLVGVLQALMQTGRLKVARALPEAEVLTRELAAFRAKVTLAGNETLEAWRERDHDDLVLALAVALWYAERRPYQVETGPCVLTAGRQEWW